MSTSRRAMRIALVQMPFAVTSWPSLGLSQLKAILVARGHSVRVHYLNKHFSDLIGGRLYDKIANGAPHTTDLFGEWVFSTCLWGRDASAEAAYVADVLCGRDPAHAKNGADALVDALIPSIDDVLRQAAAFVEACVARMDWTEVDVVGFTSVFQQHLASLALAAVLKARHPHLTIVFGGANCEAEMGLATLDSFAFVDAVCDGEGDTAFPDYVEALARGSRESIAGMVTRADLAVGASLHRHRSTVDMNALPYPDFDDFFADAPCGDEAYASRHRFVFESSRGCWWGQKNHCTFCGLNGTTMHFRQKSGARAAEELLYLIDRYGRYTRHVMATDNIMPLNFFKEFLPRLAAGDLKINLFYETKANLRKAHLRLYRDAGLEAIQPGIESLSSDVLKRMRKGITALQNVQLLKWCREFGISAKWNVLAGFPGEDPRSYAPLAAMARKLTHLDPPIGVSNLRFDRFSPYHSRPSDHAITRLLPFPVYAFLYRGLDRATVARFAYYFTADFPGADAISGYTADGFRELRRWKTYGRQSALFHVASDDETIVYDLREDEARTYRLRGRFHDVFARCDGITGRDAFDEPGGADDDLVLETLLARGLFLEEDGRYLNLSIPLDSDYQPPPRALEKLELNLRAPSTRDAETAVAIMAPRGGMIALGEPHQRREMDHGYAAATH